MKSRRNPILLNNESAVLKFLWKYRLATFLTLKTRFFTEQSPKAAYDRMRKLADGEFIRMSKVDGTPHRIWCLDKRGFNYLEANVLPDLKSRNYKPHRQYHDLLAAAGLIGNPHGPWPAGLQAVSEQELATIEIPELPISLRKEMTHHPDGLWIFKFGNESKAVGLEIEISAKSSSRYEQTCAFYGSELFFEHVVWVVESKAVGDRILEASRRYGIPREGVHLFILQEDFEANLWQSRFLNSSKKGISLEDLLVYLATGKTINRPELGVIQGSSAGHPEVIPSNPSTLLDFRFRLTNSQACSPLKTEKSS